MKNTTTATGEAGDGAVESAAAQGTGKDAAGPDSEPAPWGPIRSRLGWGSIATAVVVVFLALTAGWATWQWKQVQDLESAREQALDAAQRHAVVVASYDHRDLDSYVEKVNGLATGNFADQFAKTNEDLRMVVERTEVQVEATVVDAAVRSASEDEAVVLLFVDQTVKGTSTDGESIDRVAMRMTVVRSGDQWLVSKIARP